MKESRRMHRKLPDKKKGTNQPDVIIRVRHDKMAVQIHQMMKELNCRRVAKGEEPLTYIFLSWMA